MHGEALAKLLKKKASSGSNHINDGYTLPEETLESELTELVSELGVMTEKRLEVTP
jgi:hypothetical protein